MGGRDNSAGAFGLKRDRDSIDAGRRRRRRPSGLTANCDVSSKVDLAGRTLDKRTRVRHWRSIDGITFAPDRNDSRGG